MTASQTRVSVKIVDYFLTGSLVKPRCFLSQAFLSLLLRKGLDNFSDEFLLLLNVLVSQSIMLHSTRSRPRSKLGNMTTSSSGRVSCLGIISPRSATLLLALLGCVAHIQQFNYLSNLHDSFPHVPKVRSLPPTTISGNDYVTPPTVTPAAELPKSYIHAVTNIDESLTHTDAVTSIASTSAIYNLASPNVKGKNGSLKSTSKEAAAALAKPARWFNLLPSRFPQNDSKSANVAAASSIPSGFVEQDWKARQRDQEEDRKSWEAARSLTLIVRLYALICAVMCLCGVIGVLRVSLYSTCLSIYDGVY